MSRSILPLTASLLLWAVAGTTLAAEPALRSVNCSPTGVLRGDAESGAVLHLKHCAACHGADGSGTIVMHMDVPPRDQSDPVYMKTLPDEFLYLAICKGGEAVGRDFIMEGWGDLLSDQDIKDLVAQIRSFSGT